MIALLHPIIGMLWFTDYEAAMDAAGDVGEMYDLNAEGYLKSRAWLIHL